MNEASRALPTKGHSNGRWRSVNCLAVHGSRNQPEDHLILPQHTRSPEHNDFLNGHGWARTSDHPPGEYEGCANTQWATRVVHSALMIIGSAGAVTAFGDGGFSRWSQHLPRWRDVLGHPRPALEHEQDDEAASARFPPPSPRPDHQPFGGGVGSRSPLVRGLPGGELVAERRAAVEDLPPVAGARDQAGAVEDL